MEGCVVVTQGTSAGEVGLEGACCGWMTEGAFCGRAGVKGSLAARHISGPPGGVISVDVNAVNLEAA